jgi:hypothetical protein
MRPSQATLEKHLKSMIADMPVAVTFGDQEHDCAKSVISETERAAAAGELTGYKFSLYAVISDWTPVPQIGELLTVGGVEYRILSAREDVAGVRWDVGEKYSPRES